MGMERALRGCLLGTAVGDSLGLPYEGIPKSRQTRLYPAVGKHRLLFSGKGMVSDDTEHACMTAQALIRSAGEPELFAKALASELRKWLVCLPAGIGLGTLRAIVKLWLGFSPARSGVRSAGNGPCMRSPLLGVAYGQSPKKLAQLVQASTRITHTDPRAFAGAYAVALAASLAAQTGEQPVDSERFRAELRENLPAQADELHKLIETVEKSVRAQESTERFVESMGWHHGVSGYVYQTVPAVLHAWLRYQPDFQGAVIHLLRCGGDTDTTGAILGGIVGAQVGEEGIPAQWLKGIWEYPRSIEWMRQLTKQLAGVVESGEPQKALRVPVYALVPRNGFFLLVVLTHGFRRLLPPY